MELQNIMKMITNPIFFAVHLLILKTIIPIFKKYNIQPFLDGGTMLSYLRYGGFMSWDDDFDLSVYFENDNDYNVFAINFIKDVLEASNNLKACVWVKQNSHFEYSKLNNKAVFINNVNNLNEINKNDIYFFNITIHGDYYIKILNQFNIDLSKEEYHDSERKYIKTPWIDVFPYTNKSNNVDYHRVYGSVPKGFDPVGKINRLELTNLKKIYFMDIPELELYVPFNPIAFIEKVFGRSNMVSDIVIDGKHGWTIPRIRAKSSNKDIYSFELKYNKKIKDIYTYISEYVL